MSLKFEFTANEVIQEGRVKKNDIDSIREWMKDEHLPEATDEQICYFLLSCQNNLEETRKTIVSHYKCKYQAVNFTTKRDMSSKELTEQITVVESCVIPRRTKTNDLVLFQRLKNYSHWSFHLETSMKYMFMTLDLGLLKGPPDGLVVLFDMKGVGLMHLTKLRVGPLRIFFEYLQEGLPCRIKAIHVLNSVYFVDKLIAIIRPFMKKELYEMLHFHSSNMDMKEFFEKCIEAECVPSDYGGKQPSVRELDMMCVENLKQMKSWFEAEEDLRKNYKPRK